MSDDYLWDGTGDPDPDVQRLERVLAECRASPRALDLPAAIPASLTPRRGRTVLIGVAVAAAAAIVAASLTLPRIFWDPRWSIVNADGPVTIDGAPTRVGARLAAGARIDTGASAHATLQVGRLGIVVVGPDSHLSLREATRDREEAELTTGTVRAAIAAEPYVFLIRTPSAYALDMGCAYTLTANPDGSGTLTVTEGWIAFEHGLNQSMVPAGASADMRPGLGPGAPYFQDAPPAFRQALAVVNFDAKNPSARSAALATVLAEARPRDAFTLLNLFRRVDAADRGRLYDRLVALEPAAAIVSRDAAVSGDIGALDPVWRLLGLAHMKKGTRPVPRIVE